MRSVLEAFFRAAVYCLHPRVIALSFLPLAITIAGVLGLGYFFWNDAIEALRLQLEAWAWIKLIAGALDTIGLGGLRAVMAPALLLFATIPFIVIICLLMVSFFMTPAMVALVAERRFPGLERKKGASLIASVAWALGSTLAACLAMALSVPLWLLPPLVLVPVAVWIYTLVFAFSSLWFAHYSLARLDALRRVAGAQPVAEAAPAPVPEVSAGLDRPAPPTGVPGDAPPADR